MRVWMLLIGLAVLTLVDARIFQGADAETARVAELIRQLGDDEFARREAARKALIALGEPALEALRKAAAADADLEVRLRAGQVIKAITPPSSKSKSIGLEMILVEGGRFEMGSPNGEAFRRADESRHAARITTAFYLGVYEVTQDEYQRVMNARPSWFSATGDGKGKVLGLTTSRFPVERVSWFDAIEFCNRLSKMDGLPPYYSLTDVKIQRDSIVAAQVAIVGRKGYRLPTEAEWEYACRAGTETEFHFGRTTTGREANFKAMVGGGYGAPMPVALDRTTIVGSYKPNHWGLFDMHGNVAEWCWDWYDKDYYAAAPVNDPTGPKEGAHRSLRGGSWLVAHGNSRSASRYFLSPGDAHYQAGFRVARAP